MMQRVAALTGYFLYSLFFSLSGLLYLVGALAFWWIAFNPTQGTPDSDYYVLVLAVFGATLSFLAALTLAARANQSVNYPVVVRLPSRVEYLTAVLLSALLFALFFQLIIALLALFRGPTLSINHTLEIPPIWFALNILAVVLALHASDFITNGWSRVYVFGVLAIFLFGQNAGSPSTGGTLAQRLSFWGVSLSGRGWATIGRFFNSLSDWVNNGGDEQLNTFFGFPFWPFHAIADATITGFFTPIQALAPAVILIYATILFILAAAFFASKDLHFTE